MFVNDRAPLWEVGRGELRAEAPSWPTQNPLIIGRERTGAAGKPDALILRDRPPDGDWVWAGQRLLESPIPFWVKRSIWLIRCYHLNDRFYWIPRDSRVKIGKKRGHKKTSLLEIAPCPGKEMQQAQVDRLLLDLESVGSIEIFNETAFIDFTRYRTLDDDQAKLDELAELYGVQSVCYRQPDLGSSSRNLGAISLITSKLSG